MCPACHQQNAVSAIQCVCGHMFRTQFAPAVPPSVPPPVAFQQPTGNIVSHACPNCQNTDIGKVSAIVGQGAWATSTRGHSIGGGHVMGGPNFVTGSLNYSNSASATGIAQQLSPPAQPFPRYSSAVGTICFAIVAGFCGIWLLVAMTDKNFASAITAVVFTVVFAVCAILVHLSNKKMDAAGHQAFDIEMQRWNLAMRNWDCLYYCPKCDSVHHAETKQVAPSHSMGALL